MGGLSLSNHRFPIDPKRQVRQAMWSNDERESERVRERGRERKREGEREKRRKLGLGSWEAEGLCPVH